MACSVFLFSTLWAREMIREQEVWSSVVSGSVSVNTYWGFLTRFSRKYNQDGDFFSLTSPAESFPQPPAVLVSQAPWKYMTSYLMSDPWSAIIFPGVL